VEERKQIAVETTYAVNYTTKDPVPIAEIITSLRSLEAIIKRSGPFVEARYAGIEILDIQVYVTAMEAGSLKEWFLVRLLCGSAENAEELEALVERMMKDSKPLNALISAAIGGLIVFGLTKCSPDAPHTTEFFNNTIINIGAEMELDVGDVQLLLDGVRDKKRLARDAVEFVRPAKGDPSATIENDALPALAIPPEVIAETPLHYEPPEQREQTVIYTNVPVLIYASDRDKRETVWAGMVPGVIDRRIRFILDDSVDPAQLHGRTRVHANIVVVKRFSQSSNAFEPKKVVLTAVN